MTRAEVALELRDAGWPAVAEDVAEGVPAERILRNLRAIGEGDTDAAAIVAAIYED